MITIGEIILVGAVTVLTVLTLLVGIQLYRIFCSLKRILQILREDLETNRQVFWQNFITAQEEKEEGDRADQIEIGLSRSKITSSRRSFRRDGKQLN